jgi:hypothetical protein
LGVLLGVTGAFGTLGVSGLSPATAASDPVVEISFGGDWTIDNSANPPASQLATRSRKFEASWYVILSGISGEPVRLSDLKRDLSTKHGTFELFNGIRWIAGRASWSVDDIRPGSSCHTRGIRSSVVTIGQVSHRHLFGDIDLGYFFNQPSSPCVAPDYLVEGQGTPTWEPKIESVYGYDDPFFRHENVVFPINIPELVKARIATIPVSYRYTYENKTAVYNILDKWSGQVEIRLR